MYHVSIKKYKPRCGFFEKKGKLEVSDFSVKITSAKVFELSFINTQKAVMRNIRVITTHTIVTKQR